MPLPHEFQVWFQDAPVICIGADLEFDCCESTNALSGSFICIDETYDAQGRRRADIS